MTPAARLQAAIEILDWLGKTDQPLDRFLRDWFRARRYAGSKDRRGDRRAHLSIQRRRASLLGAWRMAKRWSARALVIASLLAEGADPENRHSSPATVMGRPLHDLSADERAHDRRARRTSRPAALGARANFPPFLES